LSKLKKKAKELVVSIGPTGDLSDVSVDGYVIGFLKRCKIVTTIEAHKTTKIDIHLTALPYGIINKDTRKKMGVLLKGNKQPAVVTLEAGRFDKGHAIGSHFPMVPKKGKRQQ
jgi:hypothetical protein